MSSTVSRLSAAKPRVSRTGRVWMRLRDRRREVTEDGAGAASAAVVAALAEDSERYIPPQPACHRQTDVNENNNNLTTNFISLMR